MLRAVRYRLAQFIAPNLLAAEAARLSGDGFVQGMLEAAGICEKIEAQHLGKIASGAWLCALYIRNRAERGR